MLQNKKLSPFFVPGIIVVGAVLRIPFTAIPPVLSNIANSLHVPVNSLGILTTIPLLMFAIFSSVAPMLAKKIGIERLFTLTLLAMIIGSFIRIFNLPMLYIGTIIIGAAIAMLNVLLPSAIMANAPTKIGRYTTIYSSAMAIASAIASAVAVPIVLAGTWQTLILVLTAILVVAFFIWFPNTKNNHILNVDRPADDTKKSSSIWRNKYAWMLLGFGGLQSYLFYTGLTWLPTLAQEAGVSQGLAGILAGVYSLLGLPISMFLPIMLTQISRQARKWLMVGFSFLGILGVILMLIPSSSFLFWLLINVLIGLSVGALFPYLLTAFSLKTNSANATAELSGMAQTGGYFLAAVGPASFGYFHSLFGSWVPGIIILAILTILMTVCLVFVEQVDKITNN